MDKKTILSPPGQFSEGQYIEIDKELYVVYGIIPVNKYTDEVICVSYFDYVEDCSSMTDWNEIQDGHDPYDIPF